MAFRGWLESLLRRQTRQTNRLHAKRRARRPHLEELETRNLLTAFRLGSTAFDTAVSVKVDNSGNLYVCGSFNGTVDFDPGVGTTNLVNSDSTADAFVAKYNSIGQLQWVGQLPNCTASALTLDGSGNLLLTGSFSQTTDFDFGSGNTSLTTGTESAAYVAKYTSSGGFSWAARLGGQSAGMSGAAIATDSAGNVYSAGVMSNGSADLDPSSTSSFTLTNSSGNADTYISKLDAAGNFVWAKKFSNDPSIAAGVWPEDLAVDASQRVYVSGIFVGRVDFDTSATTAYTSTVDTNFPSGDAYLARLTATGDLDYLARIGTATAREDAYGVAVDGTGNAYVTGAFGGPSGGTLTLTTAAGTSTLFTTAGDSDLFVMKFTATGGLDWARRLGSTGNDGGASIALGTDGLYLTGFFNGTVNFDPNGGTQNVTGAGGFTDVFILKLGTDSTFDNVWAIGGTDFDYSYDLAVNTGGDIGVVGRFQGSGDFQPGPNVNTLTSAGDSDAFVVFFSQVNRPPVASDGTLTTLEDTAATGTLSASDVNGDALTYTLTSTANAHGTVQITNAATGAFSYTPSANYNGPASFTFQANDGIDSSNTATVTITVTSVNDAPAGTNNTVTTLEDTPYTFHVGDFGFTDPGDAINGSNGNALLAVKITTVPGAGTLTDSGSNVSAGQFVSFADINGGKLVFTPVANANGTPYASFTFQVQDNGGTANGGVDLDQSPNTMTINVTSVNDAPAGTDNTVTTLEDTAYVFHTADFGFSDPNDNPPNTLAAVKITTVPSAGTLMNGTSQVAAGTFVAVNDITTGKFRFVPAANANGAPYASFTFQVADDGATYNGGVDLDQSPNTMTVNVTSVNDAPAGADNTVTTLEDHAYTFAAADFGFTDAVDAGSAAGANALLAVKITTLPGAGTLTNNGSAVSAGQFVSAADINGSKLVFTPAANANGTAYASFTFQVQDNGSTANGGVDLDQSPNTMTVNVTSVNDAPAGTDNTVTTLEDTAYTFAVADFGFSDPVDAGSAAGANALLAVKITTLPGAGTLSNNGSGVSAGQSVSAADISAGKLVFTPAANANGAAYASFTFQVQDNGGTSNGGVDLDQSPNTMTVNVTSVNDAPAGADNTVTTLEDNAYTFTAADFGFSDPVDAGSAAGANALLAVKITTLPGAGTLTNNGSAVSAGQFVSAADISAGKMVFTPAANANGTGYASFTFQVQDNGGTANGGVDLDQSPNTMTVNVTSVNDAPAGTNNTVTTLEDNAYTFAVADFGFSDPVDAGSAAGANALLAVKITTLPGAGTLTNNGSAVSAGQFVSAADISAGKLVFTPAANGSGTAYASFTFQVQDNGGTANGGVNLDASPNTLTINVTPINVAIDIKPSGDNNHINPNSEGKIEVVILSSSNFNAQLIDISSLRFGRTGQEDSLSRNKGAPRYSYKDVNHDGLLDLVVEFDTESTGFQAGDTLGVLTGRLQDGTMFTGTDSITTNSNGHSR
jgi:hypothetical protein